MGNTAGKLDHLQPALDIALRIGHHLAMLAGQQFGQFLHVAFDKTLELEHHAGAALRIGGGPGGLRGLSLHHGQVQHGGIAQHHLGLNGASRGVEHRRLAQRARGRGAGDQMVDETHEPLRNSVVSGRLRAISDADKRQFREYGLQLCSLPTGATIRPSLPLPATASWPARRRPAG
jgi:hypothetical protein